MQILEQQARPAARSFSLSSPEAGFSAFHWESQYTTGLAIRVLKTHQDRLAIAHLRQYADSRSEYELDPGLAEFETTKDNLGIVMAISLHQRIIATIRFIPAGHGVTLTERFWHECVANTEILGSNSWEVGRLVVAPEDRRADLLPQCLALTLRKLVELEDVQHLHASCLTSMTRLYRRFGFVTQGVAQTKSGKKCALIYGPVNHVAAALKVSIPTSEAVQAGLRSLHSHRALHMSCEGPITI